MNAATEMIPTTPFPMYGYEDALLGGDVTAARLNRVYQAIRARKQKASGEGSVVGEVPSSWECARHYYLKALDSAAGEWPTLQPEAAALGPRNVRTGGGDDLDYLDSVYDVSLSFSLAAIWATAKGELTRPLVLSDIS